MRTLHLIESAHTGHTTSGLHSFLSLSAHGTILLAALYATTRPTVQQDVTPDARVYFVPEPRAGAAAPTVRESRPAPKKPATPVPAQAKTAAVSTFQPSTLPAVDVPLADPSAPAIVAAADGGPESSSASPAGTSDREGAYGLWEVEVPAAPLSKSGPEYPERAIRLALTGSVTAQFVVNANGRVEDQVAILDSTSPDFTSAVRSHLRRARFSPARVGGRAVRQMVEQRFVFELRR